MKQPRVLPEHNIFTSQALGHSSAVIIIRRSRTFPTIFWSVSVSVDALLGKKAWGTVGLPIHPISDR